MRSADETPTIFFIPDFCNGRAVLGVVLLTELVAIVLALAGAIGDRNIWAGVLLLSLYLQWIGLACCIVLCGARRWLERVRPSLVVSVSYVLLVGVSALISEAAYRIGTMGGLAVFVTSDSHFDFLLRNVCISAIVSAVLLRYLYMRYMRDQHVLAGAEARFQALQARIRPHFLFNSLNSLAALISIRPADAERLVEDLSELFRETLNSRERTVTLAKEIETTRTYVRIEALRLGERLAMHWDVPPELMRAPVPILTLQPLVENAIYHGIEQIPGGGRVTVRAYYQERFLVLEVENPLPGSPGESRGQRLALDNITQRLQLLFGDQTNLEVDRIGMVHRARLKLPAQGDGNETGHRR